MRCKSADANLGLPRKQKTIDVDIAIEADIANVLASLQNTG
jgi:hypothetical protein